MARRKTPEPLEYPDVTLWDRMILDGHVHRVAVSNPGGPWKWRKATAKEQAAELAAAKARLAKTAPEQQPRVRVRVRN
jgi:hypothetical protein